MLCSLNLLSRLPVKCPGFAITFQSIVFESCCVFCCWDLGFLICFVWSFLSLLVPVVFWVPFLLEVQLVHFCCLYQNCFSCIMEVCTDEDRNSQIWAGCIWHSGVFNSVCLSCSIPDAKMWTCCIFVQICQLHLPSLCIGETWCLRYGQHLDFPRKSKCDCFPCFLIVPDCRNSHMEPGSSRQELEKHSSSCASWFHNGE